MFVEGHPLPGDLDAMALRENLEVLTARSVDAGTHAKSSSLMCASRVHPADARLDEILNGIRAANCSILTTAHGRPMTAPGAWGTTAAWLFVRHDGSVRMEIVRYGENRFVLHVAGPGKRRQTFEPTDLHRAIAEQMRVEAALVADGYLLERFTSDRRKIPR